MAAPKRKRAHTKRDLPCPRCNETGYRQHGMLREETYCDCDAGEAAKHRDDDHVNSRIDREFN
jgi:hypothetical protein